MLWVDWYFLTPPNLFVHWECWNGRGGSKNRRRGLGLIWLTTIWMVWKARNDRIFKGISREIDEVVEEIKVLSWRWMLERMNIPACLYYEWSWNPILCLDRISVTV